MDRKPVRLDVKPCHRITCTWFCCFSSLYPVAMERSSSASYSMWVAFYLNYVLDLKDAVQMFRSRVVNGACLTMFVNGWNSLVQVYYIPTFYRLVYRYSITRSSLLLLSITLVQSKSSRRIKTMEYRLLTRASRKQHLLRSRRPLDWSIQSKNHNVPSPVCLRRDRKAFSSAG